MSAARQKGTREESKIRDYWRLWVPDTERRALNGSRDKGDLFVPGEKRFIVEVKNHQDMKLAKWVEEAKAEAHNANVPYGIVVHHRRGNGQAGDEYCTMPLYVFMGIAYGDPVAIGD